MDIRLNVVDFAGCMFAIIGWVLFVIFAGVGLIALPMDLIQDFIYKPKPRSAEDLVSRKIFLRERTRELRAVAESLKKK